jgi:hypothetical protein
MRTVIALAISSTVLASCGAQEEQESQAKKTNQTAHAEPKQSSEGETSEDSKQDKLSLTSKLESLGVLARSVNVDHTSCDGNCL